MGVPTGTNSSRSADRPAVDAITAVTRCILPENFVVAAVAASYREFVEQRLIETKGELDFTQHVVDLLGLQVEGVEASTISVLIALGLHRKVVERQADTAEVEHAVQRAADDLTAGEIP